jgi:hypothetical protein
MRKKRPRIWRKQIPESPSLEIHLVMMQRLVLAFQRRWEAFQCLSSWAWRIRPRLVMRTSLQCHLERYQKLLG